MTPAFKWVGVERWAFTSGVLWDRAPRHLPLCCLVPPLIRGSGLRRPLVWACWSCVCRVSTRQCRSPPCSCVFLYLSAQGKRPQERGVWVAIDSVRFCKPESPPAWTVVASHLEKRLTLTNVACMWLSHLGSAPFRESLAKSPLNGVTRRLLKQTDNLKYNFLLFCLLGLKPSPRDSIIISAEAAGSGCPNVRV